MDMNLQKQMAFNEKLNKLLEETQKKKPFNYDIVFIENNEFKKGNTLLQVKFKALSMEEKDVDLWWDVVQDIVQKDIGKVCKKYQRNERLYKHIIFQMEKVMPSFEYEPLILFLKLETSDEEEDKGDTYGVGPLGIRFLEEPGDLIGRKASLEREDVE
jgi:hypothetical protein